MSVTIVSFMRGGETMQCDLCGKDTMLVRVKIENTVMNVCRECSRFGQVLKEPPRRNRLMRVQREEVAETIVEDYAAKIKRRREELGLAQEDFAKQLNEKLSLVHKIETGGFVPSIMLARKIEKHLNIRLVEAEEQEEYSPKAEPNKEGFTLGDALRLKK
jgi:putative transcription factor